MATGALRFSLGPARAAMVVLAGTGILLRLGVPSARAQEPISGGRVQAAYPAASDIVSLHSVPYGEAPAPVLEAFGIDCVGWGLPPQRESEIDGWAKAWIRQHLDAGARYHAVLNLNISNGYLTGPEPQLLATRCVTADGGFRGPRHSGVLGAINGQPSWWHCVNNPGWREQLRRQAGYALAAGAQGIQFDDPRSGASPEFRKEGLCFCEHCLAGFERACPDLGLKGEALKAHLAEKLAATPQYPDDPVLRRYLIYELRSAVGCMEEVIAHTRAAGGDGVQFTVNAFDMAPESLAFVPACNWLLTETSHYADLWNDGTLTRSLAWRYRLPDAFGKRVCAVAPLWEWRYLQDHGCVELLKLWFAAAYAHGHLYTVPNYYSWSGIPLRGKAEDFAPLIRFVKDSRAFLDGYTHVASAAVVYSPDDLSDITGLRDKPIAEIMDISTTLAYRQLDFDFAIATNSLFEAPQWPDAALVVLPQTAHLTPGDRGKLKPYEDSGRLIRWPEDRMRLETLRTTEAPAGVWVKPRVHCTDPERRVYHLLNGRFDYPNNRVETMGAFPLRFAVPEGWSGVEATYHAPEREATPLSVRLAGGQAEVTIPSLGYWGLLEVRAGDSLQNGRP